MEPVSPCKGPPRTRFGRRRVPCRTMGTGGFGPPSVLLRCRRRTLSGHETPVAGFPPEIRLPPLAQPKRARPHARPDPAVCLGPASVQHRSSISPARLCSPPVMASSSSFMACTLPRCGPTAPAWCAPRCTVAGAGFPSPVGMTRALRVRSTTTPAENPCPVSPSEACGRRVPPSESASPRMRDSRSAVMPPAPSPRVSTARDRRDVLDHFSITFPSARPGRGGDGKVMERRSHTPGMTTPARSAHGPVARPRPNLDPVLTHPAAHGRTVSAGEHRGNHPPVRNRVRNRARNRVRAVRPNDRRAPRPVRSVAVRHSSATPTRALGALRAHLQGCPRVPQSSVHPNRRSNPMTRPLPTRSSVPMTRSHELPPASTRCFPRPKEHHRCPLPFPSD